MDMGEAKKLARFAVLRFGVAEERVRAVLKACWKARQQGRPLDLVDELKRQRLVTADQASQLRGNTPGPTELKTRLVPARPLGLSKRGLLPATEGIEIGGYRLLRKLGEGAMAEVHLARSPDGQMVAIKALTPAVAADASLLERFRREAEHGMRLQHPNLVRVLGAGFDANVDRHFILLEHVNGPSTQHLLDRLGKLGMGDALRIALDVAVALEYLHRNNIIHRDVKPENVLLTETGLAKLADLGLSKEMHVPSSLTKARHGFGTPFYMPYEQAVNAKKVDERGDLFALGATLYHWLTGQLPFDGVSALEIMERKNEGTFIPASLLVPELPEAVDDLLARLLARNPAERFQTATDLVVAIQRSGLAAETLSFVDRQLALSDPNIQMRAAIAQAATEKDVTVGTKPRPAVKVWYVRFLDGQGRPRTLMATTQVLLKALQRGQVPVTASASRSKEGEFTPLNLLAEFKDRLLLALPAPKAPRFEQPEQPTTAVPGLLWSAVFVALGVLGLVLVLVAHLRG